MARYYPPRATPSQGAAGKGSGWMVRVHAAQAERLAGTPAREAVEGGGKKHHGPFRIKFSGGGGRERVFGAGTRYGRGL